MKDFEIFLPDIGNFAEVKVIEILVRAGERIRPFQSLITVECDKATLEIPSEHSGVVKELKVNLGDKVSKGSLILILQIDDSFATLSTAEMKQRATDSNNKYARKFTIFICLGLFLFCLAPYIGEKYSFLEFLLTYTICHFGAWKFFPSFLLVTKDKCPQCGILNFQYTDKRRIDLIKTEVIKESEQWVWGTRKDAIRDINGRVTGYIDRRERVRKTYTLADYVYHCKFCDSTWTERHEHLD